MSFDFIGYQTAFNAGDDDAALEFWDDELVAVMPVNPTMAVPVATNKEEFRQFLAAAHDGIREVMRVQTYLEDGDKIFIEFDMDFVASKDRPDFPFAELKAGQFITVKMFGVYTLRNDKLWKLNMAFWPTNQGVSEPPFHVTGIAPPDFGELERAQARV